MKIIALIPAKSVSVRVKSKNMREIMGEPMVIRKILQLKESGYINEIYVGSDDESILSAASVVGATPVRREDIACNEAISPANVMIADFISKVDGDIAVWCHCTNPFLYALHYDRAIKRFIEAEERGACDSLLSVYKVNGHMWNKYAIPANYNPYAESHTLASDLDPVYFQDGGIFIQRVEAFRENSYFFGHHPLLQVHDELNSFDVNTEDELLRAQLIAQYMDREYGFSGR